MQSRFFVPGAFLILSAVSLAQGGGGAAMRAALEYIAKEKVKGTVEVDPRELLVGPTSVTGPSDKMHSQSLLTLLTVPGVSTVTEMQRALDCNPDPFAASCKKNGRAVFVSFSAPVVEGKVATIEVRISSARTPNRADSTEAKNLKTPAEREALYRRVARPTTARWKLELARETTAWIVTRALLIGAS